MIGLTDWLVLILIGVAVAMVGIYLVSRLMEQRWRDATEIMMHNNAIMLDELKRLTGATLEPTVGVILDRRSAHRRSRGAAPLVWGAIAIEQRRSAGRRREDGPASQLPPLQSLANG